MAMRQARRQRLRVALQAAGAAAVLLFLALVADAFVAPPAHDVHSPAGIAPAVKTFDSIGVWWSPRKPTETLADVKCSTHGPYQVEPTCSASSITQYFPNLRQTPQTLYLVWTVRFDSSGSNMEYFPSSRTLVFHSYAARPWVNLADRRSDAFPAPRSTLFAVGTSAMGAGELTIVEDDRLEHLVGDQSNESQVATLTIT
jgi:hypothetical protein